MNPRASLTLMLALMCCGCGAAEKAEPRRHAWLSVSTGRDEDAARLFDAVRRKLAGTPALAALVASFGNDHDGGFVLKFVGRCEAPPPVAAQVKALIVEATGREPVCKNLDPPSIWPAEPAQAAPALHRSSHD